MDRAASRKTLSPAQRGCPLGRRRNAPPLASASSVRLGPASCHVLSSPPHPPHSLRLRPPIRFTIGCVGSARRAARVARWRRPQRRNKSHITGTRRTRNTRKTRMTRGRITYRCNTRRAQYNLCILEPPIRLGAAILDLCGITRVSFLRPNLQVAKLGCVRSLMSAGDGANIQNNVARVMHGYLVCGHVGEEHLILSAILAAELLAVHSGCVPTGYEETTREAKTKMQNERHRRGGHQKAQHPHSTPLNNQIHVWGLISNTMNTLCFSVDAFPQLPRWPPLASHCLWLSGKRDAGIKKGLWHRRTRSSRKTWVPASISILFDTRGTRNVPCTDMRHLLFGFRRHTYNQTLRMRNMHSTRGTRSTGGKVEAMA